MLLRTKEFASDLKVLKTQNKENVELIDKLNKENEKIKEDLLCIRSDVNNFKNELLDYPHPAPKSLGGIMNELIDGYGYQIAISILAVLTLGAMVCFAGYFSVT